MNFNFNLETLLKIQNILVYTVVVFSGLLLFLPNEYIEALYLYHFKAEYRAEIGFTFLLSLVYSSGLVGKEIYKKLYYLYKINIALGKGKLLELSPYEKEIVYSMYNQYNYTINLRLYDGAMRHLLSKFIIERIPGNYPMTASQLQNPATPYVLQPWVIKILKKNPKVLDNLKKCYFKCESNIHDEEFR